MVVVIAGLFELQVDPAVDVLSALLADGIPTLMQLTIKNNRTRGPMAFKISCDSDVIEVHPTSGLLKPEASVKVTLTAGPFSMPPATQQVFITNAPATRRRSTFKFFPPRKHRPTVEATIAAAFEGNPDGTGKGVMEVKFC